MADQKTDGGNLSQRWREIAGADNWAGLLDPIHPLLRAELIKYGELSQATHDAFISDIYSTKYGQCKFTIATFFDGPMMPKVGYDVTKYIYVTSQDKWWPWNMKKPVNPNWKETDVWIGFVAVSDDQTTEKLGRRDVCVTWRGTVTGTEWSEDKNFLPNAIIAAGMSTPDKDVQVHEGFLNLYTQKGETQSSARNQVLEEVKRLINQVYPNEEVSLTVTGHSLGAALAVLNAYDIMETGAHLRDGKAMHVCAMTFAGPRVGNWNMKQRVDKLKLKVLRIVNIPDTVPDLPPAGLILKYTHVGVELALNSDDSPYLKASQDMDASPHNLEAYIHLVDGYQGKGKAFKLATGRDIALVNKSSAFLKDNNNIPPNWKVDENKGMVKSQDGHWLHT